MRQVRILHFRENLFGGSVLSDKGRDGFINCSYFCVRLIFY